MQTKIKTAVYAAKLRKRLTLLKGQREKDLAKYKDDLRAWRTDMTKWILSHARMRVEAIGAAELKRGAGLNYYEFFVGSPEPPTYTSDEQVRAIQNMLRHLGITGQATITVSTDDVAKYLGDEGDD
jgi:hypothetical protein